MARFPLWSAFALLLLLTPASPSAEPIEIAGYTFAAGLHSFPEAASLVSGEVRLRCANVGPLADSVAEALVGADLSLCVSSLSSGIVEVRFLDRALQNGPGADLVVFELSAALPAGTPDPTERYELAVHDGNDFTAFQAFDPVATGIASPDLPSFDVFVNEIDLSSFGIPTGAFVDRVRMRVYDVGLGSRSADIAALGALNPLPASFIVDSAVDEEDVNPGDGQCASLSGDCTLRAAVMETNALGAADTVHLPAGTYLLTLGPLHIADSLSLRGAGADSTHIQSRGIRASNEASPMHVELVDFTVKEAVGCGVSAEGDDQLSVTLVRLHLVDGFGVGLCLTSIDRLDAVDILVARNASRGIYLYDNVVARIERAVIEDNEDTYGAGILVDLDSSLLLVESVVRNNRASGAGGGIADNDAGTVLFRSLVENNVASVGGGLWCAQTNVNLINSTVSGNQAAMGGGIYAETFEGDFACSVVAQNATIAFNAGEVGGGLYVESGSSAQIRNAIVARNQSVDDGVDCHGSVRSLGHSLVGDASGCQFVAGPGDPVGFPGGDATSTIGPLAPNGGPTSTHLPIVGGPLISAVPVAACTYDAGPWWGLAGGPVTEDQRGVTRPYGAACDIGAVEYAPACDDGIDNDGDGLVDLEDPGCAAPGSTTESPQCQDGIDNDGDGRIDFDGGASANGGVPLGEPDPQCTSSVRNNERKSRCGLGWELAPGMALLGWRWRRRPGSRPPVPSVGARAE